MHPTGMHSCLINFFSSLTQQKKTSIKNVFYELIKCHILFGNLFLFCPVISMKKIENKFGQKRKDDTHVLFMYFFSNLW